MNQAKIFSNKPKSSQKKNRSGENFSCFLAWPASTRHWPWTQASQLCTVTKNGLGRAKKGQPKEYPKAVLAWWMARKPHDFQMTSNVWRCLWAFQHTSSWQMLNCSLGELLQGTCLIQQRPGELSFVVHHSCSKTLGSQLLQTKPFSHG